MRTLRCLLFGHDWVLSGETGIRFLYECAQCRATKTEVSVAKIEEALRK